jgi:hypothetical protein
MEPLRQAPRNKQERKLALSDRALADLDAWMAVRGLRREQPPQSIADQAPREETVERPVVR